MEIRHFLAPLLGAVVFGLGGPAQAADQPAAADPILVARGRYP